jgi:BirA family biotin operon repressor/biotin-[acetyl-CoA-carboxylase] ligase
MDPITDSPPDDLSVETIQANLPTQVFGRAAHFYRQIGSTNAELKRLADQGAPEGALLLADEQLAGRGRFDRAWYAPPGSSLLTSLLFRPQFLPPSLAQQLTMLCSLAMAGAIEAETGLSIGLKWPNDLVFGNRKLAGVLTEVSLVGDRLDWAVVGVGLNVNLDFSNSSAQVTPVEGATSLQMIVGRPVSRLNLLRAYLAGVERQYEALRGGDSPHQAWAARLVTLGQPVTVSAPGLTFEGIAERVSEDGSLWVRRDNGRLEPVSAGEVTLRT